MAGKLKIKEIAAQTGVSISTVSRILSGHSNSKPEVKEAVLECARSYGVLSDMQQGPYLFRHVVVFAPPRAFDVRTDIFYYRIIQGIREMVANQEVRISYCGIEEFDSDIPLFLAKIGDSKCEAAIVLGIDDPKVHEIAADIGKPCVLVNTRSSGMRLDTVAPDHFLIGEFSANYLVDLGHQNILVLTCLRRATMENRLRGVKRVLDQKNIPFDESKQLVVTSGFAMEESREAIKSFFAENQGSGMPSVILANGDYMALGAYRALEELGLNVPSDVSIMSMDGFNLPDINGIPLTAVRVPRKELGYAALRMLQQRKLNPDDAYSTMLIGGRFEAKESVRRLGKRKVGEKQLQKYNLY